LSYLEEWRAAAKVIKVTGGIPISFSIERKKTGSYHILAEMWVMDSERPDILGEKVRIHGEEVINVHVKPDFHVFWYLARTLYLHELEEMISVNGKRALDPHRTKQRGVDVDADNWYL
jgi:hypothetical protein